MKQESELRVARELLPLTVPEVRRLLWGLVWRQQPQGEQVLAWSQWRRRHQARAKHYHWLRHLNRYLRL